MRTKFSLIAFFLLCASCLSPANAQLVLREDWNDAARSRVVPVRIDYPRNIPGKCPVIILSHGLGGTREGLAGYGQYWAEHGYIVVHLQHAGSDINIGRGKKIVEVLDAAKKAASAEQFLARNADVVFALDELHRLNQKAGWALKGKLDLDRIAMAGHSFGAITTQAMCGQLFPGDKTFYDKRIKVGIALSPSPAMVGDPDKAFSHVAVPMFHITGTLDDAPQFVSSVKAADRRVPFDHTASADEYLLILKGADHMAIGGRAHNGALDKQWLELIGQGTTAFLDKYLKEDKTKAAFLDNGALGKAADKLGTYEKKLKS